MKPIPPNHRARLRQEVDEINSRLGFTLTLPELEHAYQLHPALGETATETLVANVAGLMRLLKLTPKTLQPFY